MKCFCNLWVMGSLQPQLSVAVESLLPVLLAKHFFLHTICLEGAVSLDPSVSALAVCVALLWWSCWCGKPGPPIA